MRPITYETREGITGSARLSHLWSYSYRRNLQINETTSSAVCNSDKLAMGAMDEKAIAKKNPIR